MKNCLILGSNSDVGQACAYFFAEKGYHLFLATRNVDDYQKKLAVDISIRHKVKAGNLYFDAEKYDEHRTFFENLTEKPDVVISVFGYLGDHEKALTDFNEASRILNVNLTGNISILNIVAEHMHKDGKGTIIGVSSVAGERGRKSNYIYGSAKAGFTTYLSGLRNRLSQSNVHVSTIIPGFINTKMITGLKTPKKLTAQPRQVAAAIWKAYHKKKNVVYVLGKWRLIMFIIRSIPERIFKKMSI